MSKVAAKALRIDDATLSRTLPFALFMAFIAIDESLQLAVRWHWLTVPDIALYYLYPVKTVAVAAVLYRYMGQYQELSLKDLMNVRTTAGVCLIGLATFLMWVSIDSTLSVTGAPRGFNPGLLPDGPVRFLMTATRVAGAVIVVPLMEELFWRSFLLRYLIDAEFESVPIGRFTWTSFLATTVLFGLEHHLFVAGMVAGAIYSIILYKTRSLAQCVLAHAVTNLALAGYVLYTGRWDFW
ncbi:MAG: CAAX prenyl protease-related protein [Geobacteraceae bacterium GWC2_58_44]|nr:MAG: CAAX prenyl protease-related protein [Geobacteraceae bacterium GWC2_58_44]HBG07906.1 CAAX prenyl protease-related protein [Geobacter sp.]